ncbi:MAG: hypothetical protein IPJ15_15110 [Actinomycetales bacterium]|nr:hypothetical protein [Candidatus Phosphoribacter baldrii]
MKTTHPVADWVAGTSAGSSAQPAVANWASTNGSARFGYCDPVTSEKSTSRNGAVYFVPAFHVISMAISSNAAACAADPLGQGRARAIRSTEIS